MNEENKITIQQIHEQLNFYAGRKIPAKHLSILLSCWRKQKGYKSRGREGWLRESDARDFLRYAW